MPTGVPALTTTSRLAVWTATAVPPAAPMAPPMIVPLALPPITRPATAPIDGTHCHLLHFTRRHATALEGVRQRSDFAVEGVAPVAHRHIGDLEDEGPVFLALVFRGGDFRDRELQDGAGGNDDPSGPILDVGVHRRRHGFAGSLLRDVIVSPIVTSIVVPLASVRVAGAALAAAVAFAFASASAIISGVWPLAMPQAANPIRASPTIIVRVFGYCCLDVVMLEGYPFDRGKPIAQWIELGASMRTAELNKQPVGEVGRQDPHPMSDQQNGAQVVPRAARWP